MFEEMSKDEIYEEFLGRLKKKFTRAHEIEAELSFKEPQMRGYAVPVLLKELLEADQRYEALKEEYRKRIRNELEK